MPQVRYVPKSAIILSVILALVVVGGGLAIGYLWTQKNSLSDDLDNQKISNRSLQAQLAQAQATPTPSPTPTPTPAVVKLKEFSVSFTASGDISDAVYQYASQQPGMNFSTSSLVKADANCSASNAALGSLARVAKGKSGATGAVKVATVGSYDYYYHQPESKCSTSDSVNQLAGNQAAALQTALATLK